MIWFGLAVLFGLCVAAIARPLLREARAVDKADPLLGYREALAVLDEEEREGVRPQSDIAEDRAELERWLLNASRKAARTAKPLPDTVVRPVMMGLIALIGFGGVAVYQLIGTPDQPGQPYAQSPDEESRKRAELAALAEMLRENVLGNPDAPAEAWAALGGAYMQLGRFAAASTVLAEAVQRQPDAVAYRMSFAESLIFSQNGAVNEEALQALQAVLYLDPRNQAARFYMARAYNEREEHQKAFSFARHLADDFTRDDPKRFAVLAELWKAAVALERPLPQRFLPPPAMRAALQERGIDLPLPQSEAEE